MFYKNSRKKEERAIVVLTPAKSKRLIAKAVEEMTVVLVLEGDDKGVKRTFDFISRIKEEKIR